MKGSFSATFTIPAAPDGPCAFPVTQTISGFVVALPSVDTIHFQGSYSANGRSLDFVGGFSDRYIPNPDGTLTIVTSGLQGRLTVPGQGLVAASVGQISVTLTFDDQGNVIDEMVNYTHGQFNVPPFPIACTYLAP